VAAGIERAAGGDAVIGYISSRSSKSEAPLLPAFRKGLGEAGYSIGQNVAIEFRHSDGHDARCRNWPPIWFAGTCRCSLRPTARPRSPRLPPPQPFPLFS
jgi:hypothetical protein